MTQTPPHLTVNDIQLNLFPLNFSGTAMSDRVLENSGVGIVYEAERVHRIVDNRKYKWGGKTLEGFDCSGFVAHVLGNLFPEKKVMFQTNVQGFIGSELFETVDNPRPGDIVIFPATGSFVNHIGIVVDQERWIGSQSSTGVEYVRFSNGFWGKREHYFRRLKTHSTQSVSIYLKNVGSTYA
ncbi:C40 family peptidase [Limnobacter parvus]|uniref:C40 family peptidase n=1 Tax=Limnobacter parvus TaxID=2939690 RepID=A0ABT1XIR2_9BURK|nr:C40 family peptidase [Limnobacter parvus]MCR2747176.1 C40 family peptidase [Limnobacter parvus]